MKKKSVKMAENTRTFAFSPNGKNVLLALFQF